MSDHRSTDDPNRPSTAFAFCFFAERRLVTPESHWCGQSKTQSSKPWAMGSEDCVRGFRQPLYAANEATISVSSHRTASVEEPSRGGSVLYPVVILRSNITAGKGVTSIPAWLFSVIGHRNDRRMTAQSSTITQVRPDVVTPRSPKVAASCVMVLVLLRHLPIFRGAMNSHVGEPS